MAEAGTLLALTRDGVAFDPRADAWSLATPAGPVMFDFDALAGVSAAIRAGAKLAMRASLATLPTRTVHRDFTSLRSLFKHASATRPDTTLEEVTSDLLSDYEASLPAGCRHRAGRLAVALRRWQAVGAGGLCRTLGFWLSWVPSEAHVPGHAVRTCCPRRGALRPSDADALLADLHEAYRSARLPLAAYAMALLVVVLALRPMQVACLKVSDLRAPNDPGMFAADLLVTRLKQRGVLPRELFAPRGLVAAMGEVIGLQCAAAASLAVGRGLPAASAAMFPAWGRAVRFAPGFEGHPSSSAVSRRVSAILDRLLASREGAGADHAFPLRSRRTLATRLYDEGCGIPEISVILDHTGRDGARAYIEASADLAPRLETSLGKHFSALGARFLRPGPMGSDR